MNLNLPIAPGRYDPGNEAQARNLLEQADAQNVKRTTAIAKLLFTDTATGEIRTLTIANGVATVT